MKVQSVSYKSTQAPQSFALSLKETGFGVLTDHPISAELVSGVFEDWNQFFSSDQKHAYLYDPIKQSGYFPFKSENAKDSNVKDLKEFFHLYPWTELPPMLSQRTWELFNRMTALASELLSWIDDSTPSEVRAKFSMPLKEMIKDSREILMRPIHYPPLTGGEEEGAIRAAAHEDINLITLLPAATAPGLQVMDTALNWHDVPCDPGSIVINSGDMLKMASQGYYPSTTHRVVNPRGPEAKLPRYSMPLFLHPRPEVRLSAEHTAQSYLSERLQQIGLLKKGQLKG